MLLADTQSDIDLSGRPSVLTPDTCKVFLDALARGCFVAAACQLAGFTRGDFYYWRRRHEAGDPAADRFDDFFREVRQTLASFEVRTLARVTQGGTDWRGAAWILERRFPTRWGKKAALTHKGLTGELGSMSDEELERIAR